MGSTPSQVIIKCLLLKWVTRDCLRTGKQSRYITNTKVNSAFHPSEVSRSSTDCLAEIKAFSVFTSVGWQQTLCDPMWQVTLRSSVIGFLL